MSAPADRVPWARPELFLALPPYAPPWGVARAQKGKGLTLEEVAGPEDLRRRLREDRSIYFAWTPSDRHLRPVWEIEEAAPEVEARGAADARSALRKSLPALLGTIALLAGVVVFWPRDREHQFLVVLFLFFVGLPLWQRGVEGALEAWRSGRRLRRDPARWRAVEASRVRFGTWSARSRSLAAAALIGAFVVTYGAMLWAGPEDAVEGFGLVKAKVRAGEWWRLLSCACLHGGLIHLFFNSAAGWSLARIARSIVSEAHILGVFLASAVVASAASTLALPTTSIGASGGILGWAGLLLGMALLHRDLASTGLISSLTRWVALLALIGVAGMSFIDNAAHAGGFLTGLLAGLWIARRRERALPVRAPRAVFIAMAAIVAAPWLWMLWVLVGEKLAAG